MSNVIELAFHRNLRPVPARENPSTEEGFSRASTATKNARARREAWRKADALTRYWRAMLDFVDATSIAKDRGLHLVGAPKIGIDSDYWCRDRSPIVESYREVLVKQLLTPAPDMTIVVWKRRRLKSIFVTENKERVEKAIAADVAFFDAHPSPRGRRRPVS